MKPLCLVPARGGSKRFPRKNVAPLRDRPLLAWTIEPALESGLFDGDVWVSSEDDEILAAAERWGGRPLPREGGLAGDEVAVVDVALDALDRVGAGFDAVYVLLPTSPLRTAATIRRAWEAFVASGAAALLSVVPFEIPPQWAVGRDDRGRLRPLDVEGYDTPRQRLPAGLRHDGGHAIVAAAALLEHRALLVPGDTVGFDPPAREVADVDEEIDLAWAEFRLARSGA